MRNSKSLISAIQKSFPDSNNIVANEYFVEIVRAYFGGVIPSKTELYYLILNRYPELEVLKSPYKDFEDVALHILDAISSDEAYCIFLEFLIREYPLIPRLVFIHIAKTSGSYVREIFLMQRRSLVWNQSYEINRSVRRPLLNDLIRLNNGSVKKVFVTGHYDLQTLITRRVISPFNRVFTILREPSEIIISALNYYLTVLFLYPDSESYMFVRNIVARGFSLDDGPQKNLAIEYANHILFSEEFKSEFHRPLTRYFGNSLANALENCELYHVEFVGIEVISEYLKNEHAINKFPIEEKINVSEKYVGSLDELDSRSKAYVFDDLCHGDAGFYQWIHKSIKNSSKGWTLLP